VLAAGLINSVRGALRYRVFLLDGLAAACALEGTGLEGCDMDDHTPQGAYRSQRRKDATCRCRIERCRTYDGWTTKRRRALLFPNPSGKRRQPFEPHQTDLDRMSVACLHRAKPAEF